MRLRIIVTAAALWGGFLLPAWARDDGRYANVDPIRKAWFHSLKQPGTGISCCDSSDCKPVEYDVRKGVYWAHLSDDRGDWGWHEIPPEKVITDPDVLRRNPTGSAVACWLGSPEKPHLYCFVPGALF